MYYLDAISRYNSVVVNRKARDTTRLYAIITDGCYTTISATQDAKSLMMWHALEFILHNSSSFQQTPHQQQ